MAITQIGAAGTAASAASSSSFTLTTTSQAVDASSNRFGLLLLAKDNSSTTDGDNSEVTSVTGGSGTWTKLAEYTNGNGTAGAGVTVGLWLFEPSAGNAIGTVFTINLAAAVVDKAAQFRVFAKAAGQSIRIDPDSTTQYAVQDATFGIGSASFSGLPSQERLYYRGFAKEANSITAASASSGFTALLTNRSRNNAAAVCVGGEFRVNTSTGETSAPTVAITGDDASFFAALEEYTAGPPTYNESLTETGSASASQASAATFPNARSETVTAAATEAAGLVIPAARSETASAADAEAAAVTHGPALSESASSGDSVSASVIFAASRIDAAAASDSLATTAGFEASHTEVAASDADQSAAQEMASVLAEAADADDDQSATVDGGTVYNETLSEIATAGDGYAASPAVIVTGFGGGGSVRRHVPHKDHDKRRREDIDRALDDASPAKPQKKKKQSSVGPVIAKAIEPKVEGRPDPIASIEMRLSEIQIRQRLARIQQDDEEAVLLLIAA